MNLLKSLIPATTACHSPPLPPKKPPSSTTPHPPIVLRVFPLRHQIGKRKDPHEIKVLLRWVFPTISCNIFDDGQLYRGSVGNLFAHLFRKLLQLFIKEKAKIFTNAFLNPFTPEPPVTARADPGPFFPLVTSSVLMVKDNFLR